MSALQIRSPGAPPGFGLRQPSGAFFGTATVLKAVEGHRNPRRKRGSEGFDPVILCSNASLIFR
jgi:hypothetical protein